MTRSLLRAAAAVVAAAAVAKREKEKLVLLSPMLHTHNPLLLGLEGCANQLRCLQILFFLVHLKKSMSQ